MDPSLRRAGWLNQHTPQQAHHDAELLRRRRLASLIEQPDSVLLEHVPAIVASLDHEDEHIRSLAISMLGRVSAGQASTAVAAHAASIAERLESSDDHVRLAVVKALVHLEPRPLASFASPLVGSPRGPRPAIRWAVLEALALEPDELAKVTLSAIDKLVRQQDLSIAKAAVGGHGRRVWIRTDAHGAVLNALSRLGMVADTQQGSSSTSDYMNLEDRSRENR